MENGANGVTGVFARDHVEPEFNHAFETAIIHHQHTEESSVQGPARRRATAAQITVQVQNWLRSKELRYKDSLLFILLFFLSIAKPKYSQQPIMAEDGITRSQSKPSNK